MNRKEYRRQEIEVLAKLAGLDISKAEFHIRKCYPYWTNCYNETRHIFYINGYTANAKRQTVTVITTCDEHVCEERFGWHEL